MAGTLPVCVVTRGAYWLLRARSHPLAVKIAWREGRSRDAAAHALDASHAATGDPHLLVELIETLLLVGEIAAVHTWLERPAWRRVDARDTLWRYADFCQRLDRHTQSLEVLDRLVASNRDADVLRYSREQQLELWGPHRRGCIRIRGVPGAPARLWQRRLSIGAPAPA